jgi:hypothetical protein
MVRLETPGEPPPQLPRPADNCTPTTIHLRDTHLQPVDCGGGLFPCSPQPKAHQQVALPSFAFLPRTGSSSSLAIKHQMDVSAVSGQATGPYPLHYRAAFASSILPPAHPISAPHGLPAPRGAGIRGLPCSAQVPPQLRSHPYAGGATSAMVYVGPTILATYLLVQAYRHLWPVRDDGAAVIHMC